MGAEPFKELGITKVIAMVGEAVDKDYDSDGWRGGLCIGKGNWCMSIQAPSAGTECTCLPGFGVQLCRVLGDMPSFLNCCHVVRMEEANNTRFAMTIYNEEHSAKLS